MKFLTKLDQQMFETELKQSGLDEVEFLKKRKKMVKSLIDLKKSAQTKKQWQQNRFDMMSGIKRFHRSTAGKKFHRQLGRFLATRDFTSTLSYNECIKTLSSALTHLYLETDFWSPLTEEVEYSVFLEEVYKEIVSIFNKIKANESIEEHEEFLLRLVETNSLIKAFAEISGKTENEVEKLWVEIRDKLIKQNKTEDDEDFYKILVGTLKKRLKIV